MVEQFLCRILSCYCVHYPWSPHHVEGKKAITILPGDGKPVNWGSSLVGKIKIGINVKQDSSLTFGCPWRISNIYDLCTSVARSAYNFLSVLILKKRDSGIQKVITNWCIMHRFAYMYTFVRGRHFAYSFIKQLSKISVNMKLRNAWSERIKPRYLNLYIYDIWVNTLRLQQPSCRLLQNDLSPHLVHYHYYHNGSWKHVLSNRILALLWSQQVAVTCLLPRISCKW